MDTSSQEFSTTLINDISEYSQIQTIISSYDANADVNEARFPSVGRVNDIIRRLSTLKSNTSNYYTQKYMKDEANELISKYSYYTFTITSAKSIFT